MATQRIARELADEHKNLARIYAATSAIAKVFPDTAMALVARATIPGTDLLAFANEAESLQATLILGSAATAKGNNIPEDNLHTLRPAYAKDQTGAARLLRDQRGLAEVGA